MNTILMNAIQEQSTRKPNRSEAAFDKDAWKEQKQKELKDVMELADWSVTEVFSSPEEFKEYLDLQNNFTKYRAGNVLLIRAQKPDAIEVDTFDGWKQRNVSINTGEHGFKILTAVPYTRDTDGQQGIGFRVATAFDITQTSAFKMIQEELATDATAKPDVAVAAAPDVGKLLNALLRRSPVHMETDVNLDKSIAATFSPSERVIIVNPEVDDTTAFIAIAHAMAHAESFIAGKIDPEVVVVSEAAAYLVCKKYGVDVESFTFSTLADFQDKLGPKTKQGLLNDARNLSLGICDRMELTLHPPKREQER